MHIRVIVKWLQAFEAPFPWLLVDIATLSYALAS